jgi:predicted RNA-binding Zn ribbon-like protein
MRPLRDPLRSLVHTAAERAVREVYVDGIRRVADGKVLSLDYPGAVARLEAAGARAATQVPALDWGGRPIDEVAPLSLPLADP